jgi:hypothetical protein
MDYRIIAADAVHGQIQVTYSNEGVDVATYAIDVPIVDGKYITGDSLDAEIRSREPIWLLQRRAMAAAAEDFHHIVAMVETPKVESVLESDGVDIVPMVRAV